MKKSICLLIAVVMLLCSLSIAAAENATWTAESGHVVFMDVIEQISNSPSTGRILNEAEAQAHCETLYGYLPEDQAASVFFDREDYFELLKLLNIILYETDSYSDIGLDEAEMFYTFIWMLGYNQASDNDRPQVKQTVAELFSYYSKDAVYLATDLCIGYIQQKNPELFKNTAEMGYLPGGLISGDEEYLANYREGFQLFEEGKYPEAIEAYKRCIAVNPYDVDINLEIIEAYKLMRDYDNAEKWLDTVKPYVVTDENKANWLRKKGYIEIEKMDFELAYAYYAYSLLFSQLGNAKTEIQYIKDVAPQTKEFTPEEAEVYLRERGLAWDPS